MSGIAKCRWVCECDYLILININNVQYLVFFWSKCETECLCHWLLTWEIHFLGWLYLLKCFYNCGKRYSAKTIQLEKCVTGCDHSVWNFLETATRRKSHHQHISHITSLTCSLVIGYFCAHEPLVALASQLTPPLTEFGACALLLYICI